MRINDQELNSLPPRYDNTQRLANDELIDIVLYAVPNKWQVELQRKGIDPYKLNNSYQLVAHLENIEAAEELENGGRKVPAATKKTSARKSNKKAKSTNKASSGDFHCMYHGANNTHATEDCFVLKKMVSSVDKDKKKSGDKKKDKKGEFNALAKKAKTMRAEINALENKKRKLEEEIEDAEVMAIDDLDALNFDTDEDNGETPTVAFEQEEIET